MATFLSKDQITGWLKTAPVKGKHLLEPSRDFSEKTGFPVKILEDCEVTSGGEIHEFEGDLWFGLEGEVDFICGGELEDPEKHPTKTGEWRGSGIKGGTKVILKPGDWLWIPPGEAHLHSSKSAARMIIVKIPKARN